MEQLTAKLVDWLKEKAREAGAKGAVFGISGGIDSAVVSALCKRAFGDNVVGLVMPCHSIAQDTEHAHLVADKFGIHTETVNLDRVYDSFMTFLPTNAAPGKRLAEANLKPRLRMATLYFYANRLNYLVVGSGNRCELNIGYFTKYGDGGVDVLPVGNLVKGQVRDLARHLGIPYVIVDKPPSAGLWAGQTDEQEMELTYDQLDTYFTTGKAPREIKLKIEERMARSAHKRVPPPVPPF